MEAGRKNVELWRPNREKPESKTMKAIVVFLLLLSAGLALAVALGGWSKLEGGAAVCLTYVFLYLLFAFLVSRWSRGVLPVAASLAIILAIFAAVATPAWFARDKAGFDSPALDEPLLGLLTLLIIPLQLVLIAAVGRAFSQEWHVEEERPAGGARPPAAASSGTPATA